MNASPVSRAYDDFAPGLYQLALSPDQLGQLLGALLVPDIQDQMVRIDPTDPTRLEVWVRVKGRPDFTLFPNVAKPAGLAVYTVDCVYGDNEQPYTQDVLAATDADAIAVAQRVAFAQNRGYDEPYDGEEMLDVSDLDVSLNREATGRPALVGTNAQVFPEQVAYLAAWVATQVKFQDTFLGDDGPYADEPVGDSFRRLSAAAVAFLNELPRDQADALQDDDAQRFEENFYATLA